MTSQRRITLSTTSPPTRSNLPDSSTLSTPVATPRASYPAPLAATSAGPSTQPKTQATLGRKRKADEVDSSHGLVDKCTMDVAELSIAYSNAADKDPNVRQRWTTDIFDHVRPRCGGVRDHTQAGTATQARRPQQRARSRAHHPSSQCHLQRTSRETALTEAEMTSR